MIALLAFAAETFAIAALVLAYPVSYSRRVAAGRNAR